MADNLHGTRMQDVHSATFSGGRAAASEGGSAMMACGMNGRGLKGLFLMVACCAVPLILVLVLPVLRTGLGGRTAPVVNALAVLACPVGMALMMWMMRGRRADARQPIQEQPDCAKANVPAQDIASLFRKQREVLPHEQAIFATQGPIHVNTARARSILWHAKSQV
jgi:hypothetical protein